MHPVKETLDTYGHLWPDSDDDTREAIETTLRPIISGPSLVRESVESPSLNSAYVSQGQLQSQVRAVVTGASNA